MKSQFHALLREAIDRRLTGASSGSASAGAHAARLGPAQGKGFSWLLRRGELVSSEFAGSSALPAALLLLSAQTILKVRWFSMAEGSVGESEPLLPVRQILLLIDGPSKPVRANSVSPSAKAQDIATLQPLALEIFERFFGDEAPDRLARIVSSLGPEASSTELAQACAKTLEPLLGESMARSYFQKFI